MSRIARPGIGAVPTGKHTQSKADDEDRLGSKTIKNQLTKSTKHKDRQGREDAIGEEHLKTVVSFKKRSRVNYDESDSDSEEESRTSAISKGKSQAPAKKASSMLDDLFGKIGIDTDEIRRQEQDLETKRQKNRENREKKKLRKKQQDEQAQTAAAAPVVELPSVPQKLSLSAIGGTAVTTTSSLADDSDDEVIAPTAAAKNVTAAKLVAPVAAAKKTLASSDSSSSDDEEIAKPASKPATKADTPAPAPATTTAKGKVNQFKHRNYDESDSSDSDSDDARPVARGDVLGGATLVADSSDSDSDDDSEDEDKKMKCKKIVDAVVPLVNKNKAAATLKDADRREQTTQRPFQGKRDGSSKSGEQERKPFVRKEGTGSFRFASMAPEDRPTHDANGKRIKYRPDGRIRNTKRSKQKNIKKDNRPAHLRPGYVGPAVE